MANSATVIACLTPPGRSALAVFAVRGPAAWDVTRSLVRTKTGLELPERPEPPRTFFGWLGAVKRGEADEVVVWLRHLDPVPSLEIHCHGGPEVVRMIEQHFESRGIVAVSAQSFTSGDKPRWLSFAEQTLMQAPTVRTASIALDQMHGAFRSEIVRIRAHAKAGEAVDAALGSLADRIVLGEHLVKPWKVVLAGAPNVGKSSLINALAGFTRSVISPIPGTTRDVLTTSIAVEGWPIELTDTPGLRTARETLEQAGIDRARSVLTQADLCIWVMDGSMAPELPSEKLRDSLFVINKTDLAPAWDFSTIPGAVAVSARTGAGLQLLAQAIAARLVPDPPLPVDAVPTGAELIHRLQEVCARADHVSALESFVSWLDGVD